MKNLAFLRFDLAELKSQKNSIFSIFTSMLDKAIEYVELCIALQNQIQYMLLNHAKECEFMQIRFEEFHGAIDDISSRIGVAALPMWIKDSLRRVLNDTKNRVD
jgi:hypothetical protein